MTLDKKIVKNIAFLARIKVPDDSLDQISEELSDIIGWVEQLDEVVTDGVNPMTSVTELTWPRRKDLVNDGDCPEDILFNSTEPNWISDDPSKGGFFTVPKVVE
ncbi:MAG: Asp-tRNA(Asn)/Glu-tRNA(Gln) amidotransferase subunit GatC [Pseudomonadota bacterium]|nr:Asp-tRNA(Asn)/Glu-tRNA(Gln) amidotransferase subunit GatC [Pseudomonadota bacterium]